MLRAIKIIHSWNQIKEYRFLSDYFRMINIHTANLRPTKSLGVRETESMAVGD